MQQHPLNRLVNHFSDAYFQNVVYTFLDRASVTEKRKFHHILQINIDTMNEFNDNLLCKRHN